MLFDQNKIDLHFATEVRTLFEASHAKRRYVTLRTILRCIVGRFERMEHRIGNIEKALRRIEQENG